MAVLRHLAERFTRKTLLEGLRIFGCLFITSETANIARVLSTG